jgi:hypothetical protein
MGEAGISAALFEIDGIQKIVELVRKYKKTNPAKRVSIQKSSFETRLFASNKNTIRDQFKRTFKVFV